VNRQEQSFDPGTGEVTVSFGLVERIEPPRPAAQVASFKSGPKGKLVAQPSSVNAGTSSVAGVREVGKATSASVASPETITSCSPAQFRAAGVAAAAVVGPFTVTLTDLTPKTGQSDGTEIVGIDGIHAHGVRKTESSPSSSYSPPTSSRLNPKR